MGGRCFDGFWLPLEQTRGVAMCWSQQREERHFLGSLLWQVLIVSQSVDHNIGRNMSSLTTPALQLWVTFAVGGLSAGETARDDVEVKGETTTSFGVQISKSNAN